MKLRILSSNTTLHFKNGNLVGDEPAANINNKRKEKETMTDYKRNADGSGVPKMAAMEEFGEKKDDAISNVKAHLISKHGEKEGLEKLRTMSGLKLLELAEELRGNEDETQIVHEVDGQQQFSMPKMKIC